MIFISYSKSDIYWRDKILSYFRTIENIHNLKITFADTEIEAGEDFQRKIEFNISITKVAVLLISNNYLASSYIKINELVPFLKRKDIKIYWFLLSPCAWDLTSLQSIQSANIKEGERLVSFQELKETGNSYKIEDTLTTKFKEIYNYVSHASKHSIKNLGDLIYLCNRKNEIDNFRMIYTGRCVENKKLAYCILGDQFDNLLDLPKAIKHKIFEKDFMGYRIHDYSIKKITTGSLQNSQDNLIRFKLNLLNTLAIPYEPNKVKHLTINDIFEKLKKETYRGITSKEKKVVFLISINIESSTFDEATLLEILQWLGQLNVAATQTKTSPWLFFLFTMEQNMDNTATNKNNLASFIDQYCKSSKIEDIISCCPNADINFMPPICLGFHSDVSMNCLDEWYNTEFKNRFPSEDYMFWEARDAQFEELKTGLFSSSANKKMKVVEEKLRRFLKF